MCSWQLDGQCWIASFQSRSVASSAPSCSSVALPAKAIGSPTFQVRPVVGEVIVAVGGVLPARMATASIAEAPWLSVTRTPAR